ncbi:MAG: hypothetical protein KGR26_14470 [Cyanobacteria bacterium REEB65]|nr:hypothetical protein [Cyanobacteria bacterium REEB65]
MSEIGTFLAGAGISGVTTANIFEGVLPDGPDVPDNLVAVLSVPGESSVYVMGGNPAAVEKPGLKIIVRNTDSATAESLCGQIYRALDAVVNQSLSGTYYERIQGRRPPYQQSPIRDHKMRWLWAADLRTMKSPS